MKDIKDLAGAVKKLVTHLGYNSLSDKDAESAAAALLSDSGNTWNDMVSMVDDMKEYVKQGHSISVSHSSRQLRIGFVAEDGKRWLIGIMNCKHSLKPNDNDSQEIKIKKSVIDFLVRKCKDPAIEMKDLLRFINERASYENYMLLI